MPIALILDRANPYASASFTVAASGGTAQAANDYTLSSGSASISAGTTNTSVTLVLVDDALSEPDETVVLGLSGLSGVAGGMPAISTLTISDDDGEVGPGGYLLYLPSIAVPSE